MCLVFKLAVVFVQQVPLRQNPQPEHVLVLEFGDRGGKKVKKTLPFGTSGNFRKPYSPVGEYGLVIGVWVKGLGFQVRVLVVGKGLGVCSGFGGSGLVFKMMLSTLSRSPSARIQSRNMSWLWGLGLR